MTFCYWLRHKTDHYGNRTRDTEEDDTEVEVVDIFNDWRAFILMFTPTRRGRVGELPYKTRQTYDKASHQTPESTLKTIRILVL